MSFGGGNPDRRKRRRFFFAWGLAVLLILVTLVGVEVAAQLAYRIRNGSWYFHDRKLSAAGMVQPHPYLGVCNVPNASTEIRGVRVTHNSFGLRGAEFARPKPPGLIRIAVLGGSSTYCVGVSDNQTWPYLLEKQLGSPYEVVNMGGPGSTSVEATIQTSLLFSHIQPDIAVYYMGWNDAREQHVDDPWPDWSGFHGKWAMAHALQGHEMTERLAAKYLLKRALFHYFFPHLDTNDVLADVRGTQDELTDRIDQRALGLYERNLRNIVALCRRQGVQPVFVPQILNYQLLTSDKPYGWLPFVRDCDLKKVMAAYNEAMARVVTEEGAGFVGRVLGETYGAGDFIDNGHFSFAGNQHFARVLASYLQQSPSRQQPAVTERTGSPTTRAQQ
jgi:lysophospholipase L1-like esterase